MNYKVSIIVPIYNAEKYLDRCIQSILNQTYKNIELILVNDGSEDSSKKIIDDYAVKDNRIVAIHKENNGVSSARNDAIKIAKGDYIQFTDADDWIEPDMIEKMLLSAKENNSDIVICSYNNYYENDSKTESIILKKYNMSFKSVILDEKTNYGGFPWNKMIKKNCITSLYDCDIHFFENLLFFLNNSKNIKKYSVVDTPLYNYNINDTSAVHSKKYNEKRLTYLDATQQVVEISDDEYKDLYMYIYISKYHENMFNLKKYKKNLEKMNKYKETYKIYLKKLKENNNLNCKLKIKLLIMTRFTFVYYLLKKFK